MTVLLDLVKNSSLVLERVNKKHINTLIPSICLLRNVKNVIKKIERKNGKFSILIMFIKFETLQRTVLGYD